MTSLSPALAFSGIPQIVCFSFCGVGVFFGLAMLVFAVAVVRRKWRSDPFLPWWYVTLQTAACTVFRLRYRFEIKGLENLPMRGGVLIAVNHVAFIDPVIVCAVCRRRVRFLVWDGFQSPMMRLVNRLFQCIPVSPEKARDAIRTVSTLLEAGECVGIFPEGQISRTGAVGSFQGGVALMARRAGVPIVPAALDGLWGSSFSFYSGVACASLPRRAFPKVSLALGKPLPADAVHELRDSVMSLLADLYASRPAFTCGHLGREVVRALARRPGQVRMVDRGGETRRAYDGADLLALARWCARSLLAGTQAGQRIGILLPPSPAAAIANIACVMHGIVPVNLNFSLGRAQLEACIALTGLKTFITSQALQDKINERAPDFPWDAMEDIVDIAALLRTAPPSFLCQSRLLTRLLPAYLLQHLWCAHTRGGDAEAVVLCTSGSSGQPKGVPLSHANILGNCRQFAETRLFAPHAVLLGNLPVFHSFGFTITLWFPLLNGIRVVNTPSPLEIARNITAIREERVTIIMSTPTFLRGYMKKATPEDMASVQIAITGAEKAPPGFAAEWEARFSGIYFEGYGITETSPAVGINVHDVQDENVRNGLFPGNRRDSIGRLLPGMAARFTSPLTGAPTAPQEGGVLWLKGVNVFTGYLGNPEVTREVLTEDRWYCTKDIARMDDEEFLHIEGRQARFSKMGGEMVPHGTVEDAVRRALDLRFGEDEAQRIAVTARTDETKGECLVLLTTIDISPETLRQALMRDGLPNLWIPRIVKKIDAIPVLATGKLDLQRMRQLAEK